MSLLAVSSRCVAKLLKNYASNCFYGTMSKKSALVLIANGTEDMECVISVDVLRRGGIDVTLAGLESDKVQDCQAQIKIQPDTKLESVASKQFDVIVLPGGLKGSQAFSQSKILGQCLKEQEAAGRIIAAICAAPTALKAHDVGLNKKVTCYPSLEGELMDGKKFTFSQDKVVVDGNIITSQGPGTAIDFALTIVEKLMGKETASTTAKHMLLTW